MTKKVRDVWDVIVPRATALAAILTIIGALYTMCFRPIIKLCVDVNLMHSDIEYIKRDMNDLKFNVNDLKKFIKKE